MVVGHGGVFVVAWWLGGTPRWVLEWWSLEPDDLLDGLAGERTCDGGGGCGDGGVKVIG